MIILLIIVTAPVENQPLPLIGAHYTVNQELLLFLTYYFNDLLGMHGFGSYGRFGFWFDFTSMIYFHTIFCCLLLH